MDRILAMIILLWVLVVRTVDAMLYGYPIVLASHTSSLYVYFYVFHRCLPFPFNRASS